MGMCVCFFFYFFFFNYFLIGVGGEKDSRKKKNGLDI